MSRMFFWLPFQVLGRQESLNPYLKMGVIFIVFGQALIGATASHAASSNVGDRYEQYEREAFDPDDADIPLLLDIEKAQEILFANNFSIEIAYERLFSARGKIVAARGVFFPNLEWVAYSAAAAGLGGGANFAVVSGILLGVHALSLPSKWFEYNATKAMAKAEIYTKEAVKRNVWGELNHIYYQIVRDEIAIESLNEQCALKSRYLASVKKANELGAASDDMERVAQGILNACRTNLKALEGVLAVETAAFKNLLRLDARKELILERDIPERYTKDNLPSDDSETLALHAIENSPELKELAELVTAAKKMKKSEKWSILMFKGLGFGFHGRMEIARSNERKIAAIEKQTFSQIRNQVYASYGELEKQIELNEVTFDDLKVKKQQFDDAKLRYDDQLISYEVFYKYHERYLQTASTHQITSLMTKVMFTNLARQVGYSCEGNYYYEEPECDESPLWQRIWINQDVEIIGKKKRRVTLFLDSSNPEDLWEVNYVKYRVSAFRRKKLRFKNADYFSFTFDTYKEQLSVRVKLKLYDGTKLNRVVRVDTRF